MTLAARRWRWCRLLVVLGATPVVAQTTAAEVRPFVAVGSPAVILRHVRVIDGTGAAPREDQSIVLGKGRIQALGPAAEVAVPDGAQPVRARA